MKPLIVFGTRPELIKLDPIVRAFRNSGISPDIIFTGQHQSLVAEALSDFDLRDLLNLSLMTAGQRPEQFLARAVPALSDLMGSMTPDLIVVQGDTTTSLAGALAGFYRGIPIAHVEAGLRTCDLAAPFPEEGHRQMISRLSCWNFCPTSQDVSALKMEGISPDRIFEVGNTVIDSIRLACERFSIPISSPFDCKRILVTAHRRESFASGLHVIALAIAKIAKLKPEMEIVLPLHPNPVVSQALLPILDGIKNVKIIPPLTYSEFVRELCLSRFVISDSGGIQEEAPWLGRPVVIVRDKTERPQAIDLGASFLCGTSDVEVIVNTASALSDDTPLFYSAAKRRHIFGDGYSSERIVNILLSSGKVKY